MSSLSLFTFLSRAVSRSRSFSLSLLLARSLARFIISYLRAATLSKRRRSFRMLESECTLARRSLRKLTWVISSSLSRSFIWLQSLFGATHLHGMICECAGVVIILARLPARPPLLDYLVRTSSHRTRAGRILKVLSPAPSQSRRLSNRKSINLRSRMRMSSAG